ERSDTAFSSWPSSPRQPSCCSSPRARAARVQIILPQNIEGDPRGLPGRRVYSRPQLPGEEPTMFARIGTWQGSPAELERWISRAREQVKPSVQQDRKSTRLNSSHDQISYAVFCLKKKIKNKYAEG